MPKQDLGFTPLLDDILPIVAVDVGARNGSQDISAIAPISAIYCFEPNPVEFATLAAMPHNRAQERPRTGEVKLFPNAISGENGPATLHVSRRSGATSLLRPNQAVLGHFLADHWSEMVDVVGTVEVPSTLKGRLREVVEQRLGVLLSRYDWRPGHQVKSLRG